VIDDDRWIVVERSDDSRSRAFGRVERHGVGRGARRRDAGEKGKEGKEGEKE